MRLLRAAEVVLHDDLITPQILELIPAWTQVRNVGKRCGHAGMGQEKVNSLLISAAREGRQVVRLKAGDPMVFARGGEEMEALRRAKIDFEVVPGVTSALGAAAAAQIPLTDRRLASKLVFVSNHRCAGKAPADWQGVVSSDATIVVHMPGHDYDNLAANLCAAGLDRQTPCVIVSRAAWPHQELHRTTLEDLPQAPRLPAPAVVIIGAVVAAGLEREADASASEEVLSLSEQTNAEVTLEPAENVESTIT